MSNLERRSKRRRARGLEDGPEFRQFLAHLAARARELIGTQCACGGGEVVGVAFRHEQTLHAAMHIEFCTAAAHIYDETPLRGADVHRCPACQSPRVGVTWAFGARPGGYYRGCMCVTCGYDRKVFTRTEPAN